VLNQSSGIFCNFGAENPPLRQAAKRWAAYKKMKAIRFSTLILSVLSVIFLGCQTKNPRNPSWSFSPKEKTLWVLNQIDSNNSKTLLDDYYGLEGLDKISLRNLTDMHDSIALAIVKYGRPDSSLISVESNKVELTSDGKVRLNKDSATFITTLTHLNEEENYRVTMHFILIEEDIRLLNMSTVEIK
jgi:hypothetical protein